MPPLPLATSGSNPHVHWLPLTSLDTLMPSLDRDRARTRQHTSAQTRPELAHAAPERAWRSPWTRQSALTPTSLRHLDPSSQHQSTHDGSLDRLDTLTGPRERQARRPRRRASATVTHTPVKLTVASEPRFHYHQARQPRQDTSNTMRPSLASSPPWNDDDDDPSRAPQPPLAAIKGEPLPLN
jgi:hypothetical protein